MPTLDIAVASLKAGVICVTLQTMQEHGIFAPAIADGLGDEGSELRITDIKPAPEGNAVGDIEEATREEFSKFWEKSLFEEFCVQGGDAIGGTASEDAEVSHTDRLRTTFIDEG